MDRVERKIGQERFIFRYQSGAEEQVLDAFVNLANDRDRNFDWFDAAVLSFQLSKQLVQEADELLASPAWPEASSPANPQAPWD